MSALLRRLNLGCGPKAAPGWINCDGRAAPGVDIRADVRTALPFASASIDCIAAIHVLQDLAWPAIAPALAELRRVLKPAGVLRISVPDLDKAIRAYVAGDARYFYVPDDDARAVGATLVTQITWYGSVHTPFTFDFADEWLRNAGFVDIRHGGAHRMTAADPFPLDGGCDCRHVRYRMQTRPLFVHCCHCRWCQRESGASFALNAMIEADRVAVLAAPPIIVDTPSESGRGQKIARCPNCHIALWSHYAGAGASVCFIRVGTLDDPDRLPPDIHIFTASKQPWIALPAGTPAVPEYYDRARYWPAESLARREALLAKIAAQQRA